VSSRRHAPARGRTARLLLLSGSVIAIALAAGCVVGAGKDSDAAAQTARTTAAAEAAPLPSGSADQGTAGAEPASGPLTPGEFTLQF
jgi:hypothetical protein